MRKFLLTLSIAILTLTSTAQITVNVATAGSFSTALTAAGGNANTVTNLIVTGNIDARDVKFMRDNMPLLAILDLSTVQIMAYTGADGTYYISTNYPANEMPKSSFCTPNTSIGKTCLTSIKLPNSVTSIGSGAFNYCSGLTGNLNIPNSVITIGSAAFQNCLGFTGSLIIPNSVTSIENGAFNGCSGFTGSLNIPNSVTSIGPIAFFNCSFTGSLIIPGSVASIGDDAFGRCNKIISIAVDDNNPTFSSIDGVLFNKAKTELIQCPDGKIADSYIIPNSVISIGNRAFENCSGLTGSLIIPNSVISIGIEAFQWCTGLTSLNIPNSVTSIGRDAFFGYNGVQKILVAQSVPLVITQNTFAGVNKTTCVLVVPTGSKAAYQAADYWKEFSSITELNNALLVHYNCLGGSAVSDIVAQLDASISAPIDPTKTGYIFAGWYKEEACTNTWNFATDLVTTNITLYAKWTINTYTVSFNSQGGSAVSDITALYNTKITSPNAPNKTGYNFAGWYKEAACTNAWNFATDLVTNNKTLYAKWTAWPTAVAEIDASNLKMFPNPASEFVKIKGEKLKTVTIYTLDGATIQQVNLHGEESTNINLNHLSSGCYLVKVKTSNGVESIMKLMKN
jgi:uncharacterized repeat protein (TIGR02543 family)